MVFLREIPLGERALVVTSRLYQANAVALRVGDATVLVDSPVLPDELDALPGVLERAGLAPDLLISTHAHFDHLLGPAAFPHLPLLVGEATAAVIAEMPDLPLGQVRACDEELYLERRRGLRVDQPYEICQHGELRLGDAVLEVLPADGHADDGIALHVPGERLLLCGDYLSAVEVPLVSQAGSPERYLATLDRLEPYVRRVDRVVPGHGPPLRPERALELLDADRRYLEALIVHPDTAAPTRGPRTERQWEIHRDNVRKHASTG